MQRAVRADFLGLMGSSPEPVLTILPVVGSLVLCRHLAGIRSWSPVRRRYFPREDAHYPSEGHCAAVNDI